MDLAALLAFAGLIAGQFAAVVAVHALQRDDEAMRSVDAPRRPAGASAQPASPASLTRPALASAP